MAEQLKQWYSTYVYQKIHYHARLRGVELQIVAFGYILIKCN